MKATELIGKNAIRTSHVNYAGGNVCRSFMEEPIKILNATDTHIMYKRVFDLFSSNKPNTKVGFNILSYEYCDDKWIDYDELTEGLEIEEYVDESENSLEDTENNYESNS